MVAQKWLIRGKKFPTECPVAESCMRVIKPYVCLMFLINRPNAGRHRRSSGRSRSRTNKDVRSSGDFWGADIDTVQAGGYDRAQRLWYNLKLLASGATTPMRASPRRGPLAQLAEQQTLNLRVEGSIPSRLTIFSQ